MNTEYAVGNIRIRFESRARRRWFVGLCYAVFLLSDVVFCFLSPKLNPNADPKNAVLAWTVAGFGTVSVMLLVVLTGLSGDMRARGDERETHRREHAHYRAYFVLGNFLVGALFAGFFRGPNPMMPLLSPDVREFVMQLPYILLAAAGILYITLPQALLLWTEPDMESTE